MGKKGKDQTPETTYNVGGKSSSTSGKKGKDRTPETAYNVGGESSSTSNTLISSPECKYDVFLSFTGKDTRLNFTDHLYEAFSISGIRCFKDDVDLPKGEDLNYLFRAIEDSFCAVLVISKNYAKSTWCLDELQEILESGEKLGRRIIPIFHNVEPADVRHQRDSFGEALAEHEEKFKESPTKVRNWRTALSKIGNLSGWVTKDQHEADLIKKIVEDVWSFLSTKLPSFDDNLVGIDSKVADVIPFLEIGLDDKHFVGIWGMGGVGKTTLARVVSEKLADKFDICCFLEKVKDALCKEGLVYLQESLLSHLKIKHLKIYDSYKGMKMIRSQLCKKKVLLVLDDIDDMRQLKDLAESPKWFGKGSRIIITTRDSHLLISFDVERIYKMNTMNDDESLQMFSQKAFNKNHPEEKYLDYSKSVVKCVGGLPLALQALGSYLRGRRKAVWRDALDKLKQINPYKDILQVLKLSYDGLDEKEQTIFLDIVFLYKDWDKNEVTKILRACDLNPILGIEVLIEKTLLVETKEGRLDMHELYEDLGWFIIEQKSPNSRLRKYWEIKEVLENNKGFEEIEAIVLGDYWSSYEIKLHPEAFSKLSGIRSLFLHCSIDLPRGLMKLSCGLKFVKWPSFPLEALPLPLDELVHLEMQQSNMKRLWNGIKIMNHLKFIDLSGSYNFIETPDFSCVQSLECLCLRGCTSLVKVHESLGLLKELVKVDLHGCENLNSLPSKLETNSLRVLDLGFCKKVEKLPEFGEGLKKLLHLDASYTALTTLPESFGSLTGLRFLKLGATDLVNLPTDCFSGLLGLVFLSLVSCTSLVSLPRLPPQLFRLEAHRCFSMKCSLDDWILNLVTSLDHECRGQTKYVISDEIKENIPFDYMRAISSEYNWEGIELDFQCSDFFATMPSGEGGKIPSWFDPNIEYFEIPRKYHQIVVDVPPNFRASKWSGIVVCLDTKRVVGIGESIGWETGLDHTGGGTFMRFLRMQGVLSGSDNLIVMVLEFNKETCWQHLRGENNSLSIKLCCDIMDECFISSNGSVLSVGVILGCGWRVICKEDIQN
ncbi:hypothetical protein QN277_016572 [Acacia crassicarpa]|uniref:TIR domain-containing protein n=1 Tax=Acacia crassicarpa TaxID=499986 RepID=A0AAE1MWY1_9FABA|nr:hypothetical protein QN277_016572 [Acacia crassicarpa]